ncbi:hypothetical protein os4_37170 (plasmid) [Comamonadaceae bacterium OS-4]|nr:hypothetical protein os4_37170 [Comamonadaceae bacterium OS-4]
MTMRQLDGDRTGKAWEVQLEKTSCRGRARSPGKYESLYKRAGNRSC